MVKAGAQRGRVAMQARLAGLWALFVTLAVSSARAGADASGSELAATSTDQPAIEAPASLTLGVDAGAMIYYRAPPQLGATLSVSVGTLGVPEPTSGDSWKVRFTPPVARYPQTALLALVSRDGSHYAWARLELRGQATVELSSDPDVEVSVKVGEDVFGPVRTDAAGHAAVPVIVPPGVKQAESSAADSLGNVRKQSIPLDVPDTRALLCVGAPESTSGFLVFAADARGQPADNLRLLTEATTVSLTQTRAEGSGVYRVGFAVPHDVRPGAVARLQVSLAKPQLAAVSCEIPLSLDEAAGVDVALSRKRFVASEAEPVMVRLTPHYHGQGERASTVIELSASVGELSQSSVVTRGPTEIAWRIPHSFDGHTQAQLSVRGDISKDLSVALVVGPPDALQVLVDVDSMPADGRATTRVRARLTDGYGNPVPAHHLKGEALGVLSTFRQVAVGHYESEYRAPFGKVGVDRIVVTDPATGMSATRELSLMAADGRMSLGARAGYLTNFARVSAPLGILQLGYRTPWLGERLRISAMAGYYQSQTTVGTLDNTQSLDVAVWALPLLLRAEYMLTFGHVALGPVVGAGVLGAQSRVASSATGRFLEQHFVPLLAAGAGGAVALGPGQVCAELSYWAASLDQTTVSGNAGGMNVSLGYELAL